MPTQSVDSELIKRRGKARRLAMQAIYQWLLNETCWSDITAQCKADPDFVHLDQQHFFRLLKCGIQGRYDWRIAVASDIELVNMDPSLRAIISIAACEIFECPDIDTAVSISEAIKLTKRFAGEFSYRFVNGVLDNMVRDLKVGFVAEDAVIDRHFKPGRVGSDVVLGIGDDAAIVATKGESMVLAMDTILAGNHFSSYASPQDIGYKSLAVNISDFAAMGAVPHWATLSLSMPRSDQLWIEYFMKGFTELAERFGIVLVGGDTTKGALSVTVQLMGTPLKDTHTLRRAAAETGQGVYITGRLGSVGLHLKHRARMELMNANLAKTCQLAVMRPPPRLDIGWLALEFNATAAIDISDGILMDLGRLLAASGRGAEINLDRLPMPLGSGDFCTSSELKLDVLSCGEDYELLFTMDDEMFPDFRKKALKLGVKVTNVGHITDDTGIKLFCDGKPIDLPENTGYDHFSHNYPTYDELVRVDGH